MSRSMNRRAGVAALLCLLATLPLPLAAQARAGGSTTLTLDEAVRTALERNRDVREARDGLEVARKQVTEAWGSVYPSLSLNASYTRNVSPAKSFLPAIIFDPEAGPDDLIAVQFGADNQWTSTLSLEQPLFQARAFIGVGAASRFQALQEEVLRGRSQGVATRVRLAYYDLLLAQEQVRLLENSVSRVREALEETEALARAGLASEYEVLRLQVEVANLEPVLRQAENAVTRNRRVLGVELDLDLESGDQVVLAGSLATLNLADPGANDVENQALIRFAGVAPVEPDEDAVLAGWMENRSEVRQLELTAELRNAELRAEQSDWFPEVSLFGNYVVSAQQNGSPVFFGRGETERFTAQAVGISLSWTIFNGFQREARISQRRSQLRQASTQSELARDRSISDLRSLLEELQEARLRAGGQRLAVEQAQRGYEIASAQYREGLGSRLELSDAEQALRQSEFNYAQAVYDVLAVQARLDEAAGLVPGVDRPLAGGGE
jgi:outer membrane protein